MTATPGARAAQWLGALPVARRDVERLYQMLALQRRLRDPNISARSARALITRGAFADALAWLEIHGDAPDAVERWRALSPSSPRAARCRARAARPPAGGADGAARDGRCRQS